MCVPLKETKALVFGPTIFNLKKVGFQTNKPLDSTGMMLGIHID